MVHDSLEPPWPYRAGRPVGVIQGFQPQVLLGSQTKEAPVGMKVFNSWPTLATFLSPGQSEDPCAQLAICLPCQHCLT